MMKNLITKLHNDEDGATATEYIIMLILIACVIIVMVREFGETLDGKFSEAKDQIAGLEIKKPAAP